MHREAKTIRVNTLPRCAFKSISPHRESTGKEDTDLLLSFSLQLNEHVNLPKTGNSGNDSIITNQKEPLGERVTEMGQKDTWIPNERVSPYFKIVISNH